MKKDRQSKKWLLTINNPAEKQLNHEAIKDMLKQFQGLTYFCMADEQGETYHTHLFFVCRTATRFSTVKRRFPTAHIDRAKGKAIQCREYVMKGGKWAESDKAETVIPNTFEEWGELPQERPGERNDWVRIRESIRDGLNNTEITEKYPELLFRLRDVEYARQQFIMEEAKESGIRRLETMYVCGPTGVGKTRGIMERHSFSGVYRVTDYKHPFDGYAMEEAIVFEEYTSNFPIEAMLNYLDIYHTTLPARYANKTANYTQVYITSNLPLYRQYTVEQQTKTETFKAFLRRIHKVRVYTALGQFTDWDTEEYMENPFLRDWGRRD